MVSMDAVCVLPLIIVGMMEVDYAMALDTTYPHVEVDDGRFVTSHLASPHWAVVSFRPPPDVLADFLLRANLLSARKSSLNTPPRTCATDWLSHNRAP
jgi:hypothetical protein